MNASKSIIFVSRNVKPKRACMLSRSVGIPLTKDLGNYLRIPLIHSNVNFNPFGFVVQKIRKIFSGWNTIFFSKADRAVLIRTTTSGIRSYAAEVAKWSGEIINGFERVNRGLFWGENGAMVQNSIR